MANFAMPCNPWGRMEWANMVKLNCRAFKKRGKRGMPHWREGFAGVVKKKYKIKWVVIETTGVCDMTLRPLRYT